jgi:hypothetical protein
VRPTIAGDTRLIAHLGDPTGGFEAPTICTPCFEQAGADAVVMAAGIRAENDAGPIAAIFGPRGEDGAARASGPVLYPGADPR